MPTGWNEWLLAVRERGSSGWGLFGKLIFVRKGRRTITIWFRDLISPQSDTASSVSGVPSPIPSIPSLPSTRSGNGSSSTVIIPAHEDMADVESMFSSSSISRPTFSGGSRTTDDVVVRSGDMYFSPTEMGTRIIAPSRNSSLRRTASMTDLQDIMTASSSVRSQSPPTIPSFLSSPRPTGPRAAPSPSSSASPSRRTYGTARSSPPPTGFHSSKSSLAPPATSYVTASTRSPSSSTSSQGQPRGMFYTPGDRGPSRRLLLSPTKTTSEYSLTSLNEQEKHRLSAGGSKSEVGSVSDVGSLMSPVSETQSLSGTGTEGRSIPLSFRGSALGSMLGDTQSGLISETRTGAGSRTPTEYLTPPLTSRRGRTRSTEPNSSSSPSSSSPTPPRASRSPTEHSPGSVERRPRVQTRRPPSSKESSPARESVSYRTADGEPEKESEPNTPTGSTLSLLRSPGHTPTARSYETASSDMSPGAPRQESIRTGSFKTTSQLEESEKASSGRSMETEETEGDRSQLRRADSYFTERSATRSSGPSTYTVEEDLCLFTDHSDDYETDVSWLRAQRERSRSITPTPSTKYATASEPPKSPARTAYSTASLPSTIPTIKSESLYGTAEVPPTSTQFSTAEPYSSSTETPIPSRVPTSRHTPSVISRLSAPTRSSLLGTPTPSQVGTIPDLVSEARVSTTRTSPSPSSVSSAMHTPTMSRTMSIASRTRSRRSLLSAPSQPSPPRTVSWGGTSYPPATTPSISPSSLSSVTASSPAPPSSSDPSSYSSDSTPTPVPSTSYVFSTPSSGSFIMPPVPPPSSTIALSPPAPSSRTAGSARAPLPSTRVSSLLSSSLLERTQSVASSLPRATEESFESSVLNHTISASAQSPYLSVPSVRASSTLSGVTSPTASSLGDLVRRPSTRSIDSTLLLPSRASSLRSTTTQRESASTYLMRLNKY